MYMLDLHFHACQKASVSHAIFIVAGLLLPLNLNLPTFLHKLFNFKSLATSSSFDVFDLSKSEE